MNKLEYVETLVKWANDENIDLDNIVVSHGDSMLLLGLIVSTIFLLNRSIWLLLVSLVAIPLKEAAIESD